MVTAGFSDEAARERLAALGYDPARLSAGSQPVYRENAVRDLREALDGLLLAESLEYGLLSSATGFVAVRKEKGETVEGTVFVSSALPAGWSGGFLASMSGAHFMQANASVMPSPFLATKHMAPGAPPSPTAKRSLGSLLRRASGRGSERAQIGTPGLETSPKIRGRVAAACRANQRRQPLEPPRPSSSPGSRRSRR